MLYRALDAVSRTVGFHRINGVVVSGPRLEVVDTHPEDGIGMARVQPDVRFRCRAQVLRIHTIVHDTIMLGGAPGLLLVHVIMAMSYLVTSSSGPCVLLRCAAFLLPG